MRIQSKIKFALTFGRLGTGRPARSPSGPAPNLSFTRVVNPNRCLNNYCVMNKIMNHEQLKSIGLYWSTFLDAFLARLADEGDDRLQVGYILTVKSAATASFECATTPWPCRVGHPTDRTFFCGR